MELETRVTRPFIWSGQGILISLLLGIGSIAAGWVSRLLSSAPHSRGYRVVAQWRIPHGKGLIVAVSPDSSHESLCVLGERLEEEFGRLDEAVVMIFDDAEAAHLVRQGSRVVEEKKFQRALLHQRAMYLRDSARDVHSFTIYDAYPKPREVIHYEADHLPESGR